MSKQHHFAVYWDSATRTWEITENLVEEAIYDTETEEWHGIHGPDESREDGEALEDLRRRLSDDAPYEWPVCGASFMGGAICILPEDHSSSHRSGE